MLLFVIIGCGSTDSTTWEDPDPPDPPLTVSGISAPPDARITAWDQLSLKEGPDPGYGLYSFVLFSKKPTTESEKLKYLSTIEHLVASVATSTYLDGAGVARANVNITYIPVKQVQNVANLEPAAAARRLLAAYDYDFADLVLAGFERPMNSGPYFVSVRDVGTLLSPAADRVLMQDLSATTPQNIGAWVNAFVARARRRDYQEVDALPQLMLELRNGLSVVAELGPAVIDGVDTFVDWLLPKKSR